MFLKLQYVCSILIRKLLYKGLICHSAKVHEFRPHWRLVCNNAMKQFACPPTFHCFHLLYNAPKYLVTPSLEIRIELVAESSKLCYFALKFSLWIIFSTWNIFSTWTLIQFEKSLNRKLKEIISLLRTGIRFSVNIWFLFVRCPLMQISDHSISNNQFDSKWHGWS